MPYWLVKWRVRGTNTVRTNWYRVFTTAEAHADKVDDGRLIEFKAVSGNGKRC